MMIFRFPHFIRLHCFLLLSFSSCISFSQNSTQSAISLRAHQIIDTLCSPSMHGRGYVNQGEHIAAVYIEQQFRTLGLQAFSTGYLQEFTLPVNTFPGGLSVKIDGKTLVPGKDYIVFSGAKKLSGDYKISFCTEENKQSFSPTLKKKGKNRAIVLYDSCLTKSAQLRNIADNSLGTNCVLIVSRKLTWDVPTDTSFLKIHFADGVLSQKSKTLSVRIENTYIPSYRTNNLIAFVPGTSSPDSFLVFTAHYDHLGQMGSSTYFPGANDNASGCAMLLSLAEYYTKHRPHCSVAFIAFSAEEAGLVGSRFYTNHPLFPLNQIRFLTNLDILGTGDEGITVVNGTLYPEVFKALQTLNEKNHFLNEVKIRGKAANSDHYFFSEKGVPSFFIYTRGGIKAYHDIYDKAQTLPLTKFDDLFHLLTAFGDWLDRVH
jgi:aminopeptidase YwaD